MSTVDLSIEDFEDAVDTLQKEDFKCVLALTGGGTLAIPSLLAFGGSSNIFLEAFVPYDNKALSEFLGVVPEKFCSDKTARMMAVRSFQRAVELGTDKTKAVGIGVSASLAKKGKEREGRTHEAFFAIQSYKTAITIHMIFPKGFTRLQEEWGTATMVFTLLGHILDVVDDKDDIEAVIQLAKGKFAYKRVDDNLGLADIILLDEKIKVLSGGFDEVPTKSGIFPGSFNPPHAGHLRVVQHAKQQEELKDKPVFLELSVDNVDKPSLDMFDVYDRIEGIQRDEGLSNEIAGLVLTRAKRFYDKSMLLSSPTFLVGSDTANRIVDRKYYDDDLHYYGELGTMRLYGVNFLVFERLGAPFDEKINELKHRIIDGHKDEGESSSDIRKNQNSSCCGCGHNHL